MAELPYTSAIITPAEGGARPVSMIESESPPKPPVPGGSPRAQRAAAFALLLGTLFWGIGFTWAKQGGEAVHRVTGLPGGSGFGPIFVLAWRFTLGGFVWLLLFPAARKGWTWRSVARSVLIGGLLGFGIIVQHLGLDLTTEAVSAFLTSLTILFVPILMTMVMRKPPRPMLWLGVVVATLGVWLMTGATPTGFGKGELLGLACSVAFSVYILAVNAIVPHEVPWRITGGQFIVTGAMCFAVCALTPHGTANLHPMAMARILATPAVWQNVVLLAIFPTIAAFGLLTHFQPRLDPTRAALIYLIEPIVAAAYAAIAVHHYPVPMAGAGAALILVANVMVELLSSRAARATPPIVLD
jgi:drug/metabolite transporter (DMT)-like permease